MEWCIASRDQVKSVMLFSKEGWAGLEGKYIGISDDTATSVSLLRVLLEKKYSVRGRFRRLHAGVNDLSGFDAVLLIGDEALRRNKTGLHGFELVFDLAAEWYDWQKLPFVFAVWAMKNSLPAGTRQEIKDMLSRSLERSEADFLAAGGLHGQRIGLTNHATQEFLEGFNYRLGERERTAMEVFRKLVVDVEKVPAIH
jgi:chorismate dehydratase